VKNSADFATPVKDKDAASINKALDRDVIIFFIFSPSISLFIYVNFNSN
jgi:hypothetical protein